MFLCVQFAVKVADGTGNYFCNSIKPMMVAIPVLWLKARAVAAWNRILTGLVFI